MTFLGNILWFFSGGGLMGISWYIAGVLWSLTIIGIPAGVQCFKIGNLCFFPFGKTVMGASRRNGHFILNLLWLSLTGLPFAAAEAFIGIVLYCTIIGIPFGKQHFKIARLALTPFGTTVL